VFHGVIGGLGYLGAITRVTASLDADAKDQVETRIVAAGSVEEVLAACTPPFADEASRYALLLPGLKRAIAYACRYVTGERVQRYRFVHEPRSLLRLLGEGLMRNDSFNRLTWWLAWHTRSARFVDPLFDCTFFMDGNARMRHWGWRLGFAMRVVQQSFLVPVAATPRFLHAARREFQQRSFWPSLGDALYVPESPALLSASCGLSGFLVTFGFEITSRSRADAVAGALVRLTTECRRLGGRVQLTKSVQASSEDVHAMYAPALPAFAALKRRLDPDCLLRNAFLERVLPALVQR
jgi:FAD/FMN-containing dehydrogenase